MQAIARATAWASVRRHAQRRFASSSASSTSSQPATSFTPIRRLIIGSTAVVTGTLLAVYYFDSQSAVHRYVLMPLLRNTLDAETAHKVAVKVLKSGLGPRDTRADDKVLETEVRCRSRCFGSERSVRLFGTALGNEAVESHRRRCWIRQEWRSY